MQLSSGFYFSKRREWTREIGLLQRHREQSEAVRHDAHSLSPSTLLCFRFRFSFDHDGDLLTIAHSALYLHIPRFYQLEPINSKQYFFNHRGLCFSGTNEFPWSSTRPPFPSGTSGKLESSLYRQLPDNPNFPQLRPVSK